MKTRNLNKCPNCDTPTMFVGKSELDENDIVIRQYFCTECRNRFTSVESFFIDDRGNPDSFRQLAFNLRMKERAAHTRRTGKPARRQYKSSDFLSVQSHPGFVSIMYKRSSEKSTIFLTCKRGHDMVDPENVYTDPKGKRGCRTCNKAITKSWRERKKANEKSSKARVQ